MESAVRIFQGLPHETIAATTYFETSQVRTHICSHFVPVYYVASMLGMPSHRAGPVSFVVVVRALFGRERQPAKGSLERLSWLHGGR